MNRSLDDALLNLIEQKKKLFEEISKVEYALAFLRKHGEIKASEDFEVKPEKVLAIHHERRALRFRYEDMDPIVESINYIRQKGHEVPVKELFQNFCEKGGYPKPPAGKSWKFYYARFYQKLHSATKKSKALTQRSVQMVTGKKTFFNVGSAIKLQDEKTPSAPANETVEIRRF